MVPCVQKKSRGGGASVGRRNCFFVGANTAGPLLIYATHGVKKRGEGGVVRLGGKCSMTVVAVSTLDQVGGAETEVHVSGGVVPGMSLLPVRSLQPTLHLLLFLPPSC